MFLNNNFTFTNIKGTYHIGDLHVRDKFDRTVDNGETEKYIIASDETEIVTIQTNVDPNGKSIALEFAAIDIFDEKSIINFCNKYGLLYFNEEDAHETDNNDYIFEHEEKTQYQKNALLSEHSELYSTGGSSITPLITFQRYVVQIRKILDLSAAISNEDEMSIIIDIIWFCFGQYDFYDDDELVPSTEFERVNYEFREAVDRYIAEGEVIVDQLPFFSDLIKMFVDELSDDIVNIDKRKKYPNKRYYYNINHYDMYHKTWQNFYSVLKRLLERLQIKKIDLLSDVYFEKDPTSEDIAYICQQKEIIIDLGKAFLIDHFNDTLFRIKPELSIYGNNIIQELKIPSLLETIYIDLFFRYTPYTKYRKCSNPTCNHVFQVSNTNSKKIYCSQRCSLLMAKRKQREREKQ